MIKFFFKKKLNKIKAKIQLSQKEKEYIIQLYKQGKTLKEIQEITKRGKTSIIRVLKKAKENNLISGRKYKSFYDVVNEINEIKKIKIFSEEYFKIQSENILIFSDIHLPFTDFIFAKRMFDITERFKTKDCIIAGDLFDQNIFSDYLHYEKVSWQEEKEIVKKFLYYLIDNFHNVYILCGNHDNRILRKLEFNDSYSEIFKSIVSAKNLYITDFPFIVLNKDWFIVHPKSYSQISGQVARKLATKFQKNVISTHGHFTSFGFDTSGQYYAIDIGGLVHYDKIEYLHYNITTHPKWVKSFVILYKNQPFLFTEKDNFDIYFRFLKNSD